MVKKVWLELLLPGVLILIVGVGMMAKLGVRKAAAEEMAAGFPDRGVPRMNIALNGVALEEIKAGSKETKYEGNRLSLYERGDVKEFGDVRLKGRGNGTWTPNKKPYQIKFKEKVDLLGLGKAKKWVLLANAMDISNLRTATAFYLEEMLDMEYGFKGEFVELYVDGEYEGLYYLTHAVEIGKATVDLRDPMGVLMELDNLYWNAEEYYCRSENGDYLVMKDAVDGVVAEESMREFMRDYNEFEQAVAEKNYDRVKELVDVESFAKYYLLSEFTVNPDAYWTSFYMYKDGVDDKIHAGPGWDFDFAFANRVWGNWMGESFYSPTQTMVRKRELLPRESYEEMGLSGANGEVDWHSVSLSLSQIIFNMMEMPEFREKVSAIYQNKLSDRIEELMWRLQDDVGRVAESAEKDNEKWEKGEFGDEVQMMREWIMSRYEFFEDEYSDSKGESGVEEFYVF